MAQGLSKDSEEAPAEELPEIPAWEQFSKDPIFTNLENIQAFSLTIELPKALSLSNRSFARVLADRIYDEVSQALDGAQFYFIDRLRVINSESRVGVSYDDDEFQFDVFVDSDGDLLITRQGSSLVRFHSWYRQLMPSVDGLVSRILQALGELASVASVFTDPASPQDARPFYSSIDRRSRELKAVRAQYQFRFVGYDFCMPPSDEVQRNFVVMRRLLGGLPDQDGRLRAEFADQSDSELAGRYGRLDYNASLWAEVAGIWARRVFSIEAPGNRRFTTVWFTFSYIGETRTTMDGIRHPFEPGPFLKYYEIPYIRFLKTEALEAFLRDLTKSMVFKTTVGLLP